MAEIVSDLVEVEMHSRRIQPYGRSKKECLGADSSKCRVSYNLYIGSIMNREVCFSPRVEDDRDLLNHTIGEDIEYGSETDF